MADILLDVKEDVIEFVGRIADVLLGGKSTVPIPEILLDAGISLSEFLSSDKFPIHIPFIDFSDPILGVALIATVLPPLVWNIMGRFEYYTKIPSKLFLKPIIGVYISAFVIATLSVYRSALFIEAIGRQITLDELDSPIFHALGGTILIFGLAFFIGAYYRLRITGTYLGDYFGFLRDERITAFPFNVLDNPMYDGSSMMHLGEAILKSSPTGLLLAAWLFFCYRLGCIFEEPFTAKMYAEHNRRKAQERKEKLIKSF